MQGAVELDPMGSWDPGRVQTWGLLARHGGWPLSAGLAGTQSLGGLGSVGPQQESLLLGRARVMAQPEFSYFSKKYYIADSNLNFLHRN